MLGLRSPKVEEAIAAAPVLLAKAEFLRMQATVRNTGPHRESFGQFLTPSTVAAELVASLRDREGVVRLLDPGAGTGILTAAAVAELVGRTVTPRALRIDCYEIDPRLLPELTATLELCREHAGRFGVDFSAEIHNEDFIIGARQLLTSGCRFELVVMNPPYQRIAAGSQTARLLQHLGADCANLYSAFMSLGGLLADSGGEVAAIVPRSFANGPYFLRFRRAFLGPLLLRRLHVYESRSAAFADTKVLQENILVTAEKSTEDQPVTLSSSARPGAPRTERRAPHSEVVNRNDPQLMIRIVTDEEGEAVRRVVERNTRRLAELGIEVSTGRVVDFRNADDLLGLPTDDSIPLLYPSHIRGGSVCWPLPNGRKPNSLRRTAQTARLAMPNETYVLVKRFSSKEERRRIVATVFSPTDAPGRSIVAFENHLNVFHSAGRGLTASLATRLADYLNSAEVDAYFRQTSGHTQVNATDLRVLPYPALDEPFEHVAGNEAASP